MKPPLPVGHGQRLCLRGGVVAVPLPDSVSCARPHRAWGLAFALPFWRWRKRRGARRGGGGAKRPHRRGGGLWPPPLRWFCGPWARKTPPPRRGLVNLSTPSGNRRMAGGGALAKGRRGPWGGRRGAAAFGRPGGPAGPPRPPNKRARPGPLAPGALFQGALRPAAAPP